MRLLLFVLALCLSLGWAASRDTTAESALQPLEEQRGGGRHEDPLSGELLDRASLLFRALDLDGDKKISPMDVESSASKLAMHMPGVGVEEFLSFLEIADGDGDHALTRDELLAGIAEGLQEAQTLPSALHAQPNLLEMEASTEKAATGRKVGSGAHSGAVMKATQWAKNQATAGAKARALTRATGAVDTSQDGCVMCQYIIERCEGNVKQSGVIPSFSGAAVGLDSYLELDSQAAQVPRPQLGPMRSPPSPSAMRSTPWLDDAAGAADESLVANTVAYAVESMADLSTMPALEALDEPTEGEALAASVENEPSLSSSLLEVDTQSGGQQVYFDQTAAGIIGGARQSTRVQRQLERQKYNEIYRVVDISLDDVCEQGMPNSFYGFCKQIYKVQTDVVDGLRYQYRPTDICFRIGMCGKSSYITKGLHSRYK